MTAHRRTLGRPPLEPAEVVRAIRGTGFSDPPVPATTLKTVCHRLSRTREQVVRVLHDPADCWNKVRRALQEVRDAAVDACEESLKVAVEQTEDLEVSTKNARWLLEKLRPEVYGRKSTTVIEGGSSPVKIEATRRRISREEIAGMSVEAKRELLALVEGAAKKEGGK